MIIVTGGAGYIGNHVVAAILSHKKKCVVVDDLSTGNRSSIPQGVPFERINIGDAKALTKVFKKYPVTTVMHLAASIMPEESITNPSKYYENNTQASLTLWQVSAAHHVKNIIFSSTAAVYGQTERKKVMEESEIKPVSPYGKSKRMAEVMLEDIARAKGIRYMILRYFNVIGCDPSIPEYREKEGTHLLSVCLAVARGKRKFVPVFGYDFATPDGTGIRDYIHVSDIASAHISALSFLERGKTGGICNVGYGRGVSVLSMIKAVEKATGKAIPFRIEKPRIGDPAEVVADVSRIKKTLSWKPVHDDLDETIHELFKVSYVA